MTTTQPDRVTIDTHDGIVVARKRSRGDGDLSRLRHEARLLGELDHPRVVRLLEARDDEEVVELVTQWVGHHSLATSPPQPPDLIAGIVADLADALADLHDRGVIHGGIEPAHVLLGSDGPVLCSFGHAEIAEASVPIHARGSEDVAAVGRLLGGLLGTSNDFEPIPERRFTRPGTRRWEGYRRRALLTLADQATADDVAHRPSMRTLAGAVREAGGSADTRRAPTLGDARAWLAERRSLIGAGALVLVGLVTVTLAISAFGGREEGAEPPVTTCPPGGQVDVDGDGYDDRVAVEPDGTATIGDEVYDIAAAGDTVVLGDWDCDGVDTPALHRPSTGQVFWYPTWAGPDEVVAAEEAHTTGRVQTIEAARRGSCEELVAIGAAGSRTTIDTEEGS